jgi:mitochondrial FAD-linked sulfhydryl oxidase
MNNRRNNGDNTDDCDTCTDFKDWMKKQQKSSSPSTTLENDDKMFVNNNEPLFRDQLGRAAWSYLHTMAAHYSKTPTNDEKGDMTKFIDTFAKFFPCKTCASDFQQE